MSAAAPLTEAATTPSSSSTTSTTTPYDNSSTSINYELQVTAPPIDPPTQLQINQLRLELTAHPLYTTNPAIQRYCTNTLLHKYVRARPQSLEKARALLLETLQWRLQYRPNLILAREVEDECRSGKVLVKGFDRSVTLPQSAAHLPSRSDGRPHVLSDSASPCVC